VVELLLTGKLNSSARDSVLELPYSETVPETDDTYSYFLPNPSIWRTVYTVQEKLQEE
jgi:hypothetical protein